MAPSQSFLRHDLKGVVPSTLNAPSRNRDRGGNDPPLPFSMSLKKFATTHVKLFLFSADKNTRNPDESAEIGKVPVQFA